MLSAKEIYVQKLISKSIPIKPDCIGTEYLKLRGITYDTYKDCECLKFIPSLSIKNNSLTNYGAGLIATLNGELSEGGLPSIQLISIQNSNEAFQTNKKNFLGLKGKSLELYKAHENLEIIGLAEGLVTGLSARQISNLPILCGVSATNLKNVKIPSQTKRVIIFADLDKNGTGQQEALKAQRVILKNGIDCIIALPPNILPTQKSVDWNDILVAHNLIESKKIYQDSLNNPLKPKNDSEDKVSAFKIAEEILQICIDKYKSDSEIIYFDEKWYKRDQSNTYINVSEKKIGESLVLFMHYSNLYKDKITKNMLNSIVLNFKGLVTRNNFSFPHINGLEIDPRNTLFLQNGVFRINKDGLEKIEIKNDKDVFTNFRLPIKYEENCTCPTWDAFLEDFTQRCNKKKDLIYEFLGFCLTPHYDFHKFLYLYGRGRNGKGVIDKMCTALFGKKHISELSLTDLSSRFKLAELNDKLINLTSEANFENKKFDPDIFKGLCAGDSFTVERKYEHPFDLACKAKFIISSNNHPSFNRLSDAFKNRLIYFPITFQILDTKKQNLNLSDINWWKSSNELPAILNKIIQGRIRLYQNKKFTELESREYNLNDKDIEIYLSENYTESENSFTSTQELFHGYKAFCTQQGIVPFNLKLFQREIHYTFPRAYKPNNAIITEGTRIRGWLGIKKKPIINTEDTGISNSAPEKELESV